MLMNVLCFIKAYVKTAFSSEDFKVDEVLKNEIIWNLFFYIFLSSLTDRS